MTVHAPRKSLEPFLSDSVQYYKHQVEGIRWGARHKNFLLADDIALLRSARTLVLDWIERRYPSCFPSPPSHARHARETMIQNADQG